MAENTRRAIVEALRADVALMAMLPTNENIFHRAAPQDAEHPFVILSKQAGGPDYQFGDRNARYDFEVWTVKGICRGLDSSPAERLAERIGAVLDDAELSLDDRDVMWCRRSEDVNLGENEEGAIIHHVGAMYRIVTQPT